MASAREVLDCVAFMLVDDGRILVEKRSAHKQLLPGVLAIPGGHVDAGETLEAALVRELREELGISASEFVYICTLTHQADESRRIHYYLVEQWVGEMVALEAESLHWLPFADLHRLVLDIDVEAVERYWARASDR